MFAVMLKRKIKVYRGVCEWKDFIFQKKELLVLVFF
jgi:hypothetical protein